jgi:hypothetical protein
MITNFEELTEDLTEEEMSFKDDVKKHLEVILNSQGNPVKQKDIVEIIEHRLAIQHGPDAIRITPMRLRKFFNYFRTNGVLPIIATSNGCYISRDQQEIEKQILSLEERARQISRAANGMKKFLL